MTDEPPATELEEIVVTGQRRSSPTADFPTGSPTGGYEQQEEVGEGGDLGGGVDNAQCGDPVGKKIWNADSRSRFAVDDFLTRAMQEGDGYTLENREFGANLFASPSGSVNLGTIGVGDPVTPGETPEVEMPLDTFINSSNWMGDVHSHASGDPRPSAREWQLFLDQINEIAANNPDRAAELDHLAMNIVVKENGVHKVYA